MLVWFEDVRILPRNRLVRNPVCLGSVLAALTPGVRVTVVAALLCTRCVVHVQRSLTETRQQGGGGS